MQKYSTYLTKQTDKNLILRTKISKIHFQKMSWRFTAISIGYAALIASVGLGLYAFCFREYNACFIALLALNMVACASWLRGAIFRNKIFMVPSLIIWALILSVWIFYAMFAVGTSEMKGNDERFITLITLLALLTIFYVACYLFTVIVCVLMENTKESGRTSNAFYRDFEPCTRIDEINAFKHSDLTDIQL